MIQYDKVEHALFYHFWEQKTYSTECAKTSMNGISFCCTYTCVYPKEKMFAGIESCIFVFVLDKSN